MSEGFGCTNRAEWILWGKTPDGETFSCTEHLSTMVFDDCVAIEPTDDKTVTCCWISGDSDETPLVVFVAEELRSERAHHEVEIAELQRWLTDTVQLAYDAAELNAKAYSDQQHHISQLEQQIEQLERLVPEAPYLAMAVGILEDEGYKADKLKVLAADIQKYREAEK